MSWPCRSASPVPRGPRTPGEHPHDLNIADIEPSFAHTLRALARAPHALHRELARSARRSIMVRRLLVHERMARIAVEPSAGEVVAGKYVLIERIGEGGMGVVFLAEQPSLRRKVAIKILQPALAGCDALVRQFHTEAVAACRVQHPGAIAVIDCGVTDGGTPFIAMEYIPGRLLSEIIDEEEISLTRALAIIRQLLRTLKAAHGSGVVHADIKSDNLVVERTADGEAITLIDFGLARIDGRCDHRDSAPGTPDTVSGTPEYMAPELVRGEPPSAATDLYAAGVILYELLTGRRPFEGRSPTEILSRQLADAVIPPSAWRPDRKIPAVLDRIVLRALHKDPRARFASAGELGRALTEVSRELDPRRRAAPMQRAA